MADRIGQDDVGAQFEMKTMGMQIVREESEDDDNRDYLEGISDDDDKKSAKKSKRSGKHTR